VKRRRILLPPVAGMTFPLMSAGLIRRYPAAPGESLAMLYFTNSFGASIGVLASGFLMIEKLGLLARLQSAGALNLALAATVWLLARGTEEPVRARPERGGIPGRGAFQILSRSRPPHRRGFVRLRDRLDPHALARPRVLDALFRVDALGLHPGARLRGYWLRRRIDSIADPVRFLGIVLVTMAARARHAAALWRDVRVDAGRDDALAKTETGYTLFLFSSHGIALAIMFPATFCAGSRCRSSPMPFSGAATGRIDRRGVFRQYAGLYSRRIFRSARRHVPPRLEGTDRGRSGDRRGLGLVLLWRVAKGRACEWASPRSRLPASPPCSPACTSTRTRWLRACSVAGISTRRATPPCSSTATARRRRSA